MNKKMIGNVVFYGAVIIASLYLIKRKFIVPQIQGKELSFQEYGSGENLQLKDFPNETVVVNFWQTWCGPCLQEMPSLNEMNQIWDGLHVVCVSDESYEKVLKYIKLYPNIRFVQVESITSYGVTQYPTTYIYNSDGAKVFSKIGIKDWSDPNFIATLKKNWSK